MHILLMGWYYCKCCLSVDKWSKMPWYFHVSWNKFGTARVKAIWVSMGVQPIWIGIYLAAKCVFFLSWRCSMAARTLWSSGQLPGHDPCHAEFILENIKNIQYGAVIVWSIFSSDSHCRHCQWGWGMGCLLWVQRLIYVQPLSLLVSMA